LTCQVTATRGTNGVTIGNEKRFLQIAAGLVTLFQWTKREHSGVNAGRRVGKLGFAGGSPFHCVGQGGRQGAAEAAFGFARLVQEVEHFKGLCYDTGQADISNLLDSGLDVHTKFVRGSGRACQGRRGSGFDRQGLRGQGGNRRAGADFASSSSQNAAGPGIAARLVEPHCRRIDGATNSVQETRMQNASSNLEEKLETFQKLGL